MINQNGKMKRDLIEFKGLNNTPLAKENEFLVMTNLSSDHYPLTSCRPSREKVSGVKLNKPNALYAVKKLCWVDGTKFYYDGVEKGSVIDGKKSIADMNGYIVIFPDKAYYNYIDDKWGTFTAPDLDFITVWNNRVWGVKGNEIRCSKLGDFKEWEDFSGEANDSYATNVASHGDFTGIYTFNNHVIAFKENLQYEIYGHKPSNFQVQEVSRTGAINNKGIIESYSQLFYLHESGVYAYTGGSPRLISHGIDTNYVKGAMGTDNRRCYISLYDGSKYDLFAYDSLYDMWHREDELHVIDFVQYKGSLYALSIDGHIYKFNSGDEETEWSFETIFFDEGTSSKKKYSKLKVVADLERGARIKFSIRFNERESYRLMQSCSSESYRSLTIPIQLRNTERFQIKIEGKGNAKIHGIERYFTVGR